MPKAGPAAKAGQAPKATATPASKVFTNDDLEAGRDKPSSVQDLRATGGDPYQPPEPLQDVVTPSPTETPEPDPQSQRITQLEADIQSLDATAKSLLWQFLQSGDTNEILRLKAEQAEILKQLEEAKVELARLKSEGGARPTPDTSPSPPPG